MGDTVLEMRPCKECGKLFTPKSARSVYCDDLHYRPCPVCGKLVEAKYLSDPARCCSKECSVKHRQTKAPSSTSNNSTAPRGPVRNLFSLETEMGQGIAEFTSAPARTNVEKCKQLEPDTEYAATLRKQTHVRTYVGVPIFGFEPGHEYALEIEKDNRCILYEVSAIYDFTLGKTVDLQINMSSKISVDQNFAKM